MAYTEDRSVERAAAERAAVSDPRSVPELLSDLVSQTTTLFKKEGELIRAELSEKISQVIAAVGALAAGAVCLLVALGVLAFALVQGVARIGDMGEGWAALIVGVLVAIVGAVLLMKGKNDLEASNLSPSRTMHQVRRDTDLVKEQVR